MSNKQIIALTDYKNKFGSKHFDVPYRSGMDKDLLSDLFNENGFHIEFEYFHKVDLRNVERYRGIYVIYTSSEDIGYHYKSYIEDIIFGLEQIGAILIPAYKFLRANNNKVFMEFLRTSILGINDFYSKHYGSLKDVLLDIDFLTFPVVFKTAEGSSGTGVHLIKNKRELVRIVKKKKNYSYFKEDIKDLIRYYLHKGYQRESIYRSKFILQPFIPNLKNDWKVLIFGDAFFVLNRGVRKNDFRASGSKTNYRTDVDAVIPEGLLDYAKMIFEKCSVPHMSLDIMHDGQKFYLIEFQALYFGTSTINMSKNFFQHTNNSWKVIPIEHRLEEFYSKSIINFIENENSLRFQ